MTRSSERTGLATVGLYHIAGVRVDGITLQNVVSVVFQQMQDTETSYLVTFVNPGSVALGLRDETFRNELSRFDLVLPDGIALVKALGLRGIRGDRISFDSTSLAPHVFRIAQQLKKTVMLVGGGPGIAQQAARNLLAAFPGVRIVHAFDGFEEADRAAKCAVEELVDVVICAMGAGAQENFLLRLRDAGWRGCGFTCGGYFDQLSDGLHYYPVWVDRWNLRWAYRLYREPRRLWRRYFIDYALFLVSFVRESIFQPSAKRQE